jgi:hypothetical protein
MYWMQAVTSNISLSTCRFCNCVQTSRSCTVSTALHVVAFALKFTRRYLLTSVHHVLYAGCVVRRPRVLSHAHPSGRQEQPQLQPPPRDQLGTAGCQHSHAGHRQLPTKQSGCGQQTGMGLVEGLQQGVGTAGMVAECWK